MTQTRCAVYTRKSSEEGLEQAFNSLDAQREAGLDYIKSQKHQGWIAIETAYDDGGYSGGSTERPGLKRLLSDIERGRVDVVLVYKVDRLSRSLTDFARLMQVFDQHHVSFVSVTQQFNTTTSMGRLTLNMLLSFAQFEREVAGERIRDKIAATKRKGLWVCGQPPLGYAIAREGDPGFAPGTTTLRIIEPEAELVRAVYAGYLELASLVKLAERLNGAGSTTKKWENSGGAARGGRPLTTTYLYRVLTNPLYIGKIAHRRGKGRDAVTEVHQGTHEPIIDSATWGRARAEMDTQGKRAAGAWTHTHLLKGKVRTHEGHAMSPGSVQRPRSRKNPEQATRRIRYYISQKALKHGYASCPVKSLNAEYLDDLVRTLVLDRLMDTGFDPSGADHARRDRVLREVILQVEVGPEKLIIELDDRAVDRVRSNPDPGLRPRGTSVGAADRGRQAIPLKARIQTCVDSRRTSLALDIRIKRHDGKRLLVAPDGTDLLSAVRLAEPHSPKPHLVRAIAQAHEWKSKLLASRPESEKTTMPILARRAGLAPTRIDYLLPLASLSPSITRRVLAGQLPGSITLKDLIDAAQHLDWVKQARSLGVHH